MSQTKADYYMHLCREENLESRAPDRMLVTSRDLYDMYVIKQMGAIEIAKYYSVSISKIRIKLLKCQIYASERKGVTK